MVSGARFACSFRSKLSTNVPSVAFVCIIFSPVYKHTDVYGRKETGLYKPVSVAAVVMRLRQ